LDREHRVRELEEEVHRRAAAVAVADRCEAMMESVTGGEGCGLRERVEYASPMAVLRCGAPWR
jgi:hypothetical protein